APLADRVVLPNGVVLLVSERRALPIVAVRVYVRAGSVLDPPDAGGLANLTASLLTRGTARRSGAEIDRAIESVGGSLSSGGGRDGAAISLGVLSKDLPLGLDLVAEVLTQPSFPEDELRRKVGEIQAALQNAESDPESVAGRALTPLVYPGPPYAKPALGTPASVATLDRTQVAAFHRAHYRPDATTVVVVGDVSVAGGRAGLLARLGGVRGARGAPAPLAGRMPPPWWWWVTCRWRGSAPACSRGSAAGGRRRRPCRRFPSRGSRCRRARA